MESAEPPMPRRIGFFTWACTAGLALCSIWLAYFIFVPRIVDRPNENQRGKALSDISQLLHLTQQYRSDVKSYPEGLLDLKSKPDDGADGWCGPYTFREIPTDPWGNEYEYQCASDGESFTITSYGYDGAPGGTGRSSDIRLTGKATNP